MRDASRYLDQLFSQDADLLGNWIADVRAEMSARQRQAADAIVDLEVEARAIGRELDRVAHWSPGYRPSADQRRSDLDRQLLRVYEQRREHQLSLWRDIGSLRRELRALVKEYVRAKRTDELVWGGDE